MRWLRRIEWAVPSGMLLAAVILWIVGAVAVGAVR